MVYRTIVEFNNEELNDLSLILKDENINLDGQFILPLFKHKKCLGKNPFIQAVKDDSYFDQIENTIRLLPLKPPHLFLEYTVKINESKVPELLARTLDCFQYPYRARVDFWCIAGSVTR